MNIKSIRKLSALIGASASHFTLHLSLFTLLSLLLPLILCLLAAAQPVAAMGNKPNNWLVSGTGNFGDGANWSEGTAFPNSGTFSDVVDNGGTAVVSGNDYMEVGAVVVANNSAVELRDSGTLRSTRTFVGFTGTNVIFSADPGTLTVSDSALLYTASDLVIGNNTAGYLYLRDNGRVQSSPNEASPHSDIGMTGTISGVSTSVLADAVGVVVISDSALWTSSATTTNVGYNFANNSNFTATGTLTLLGGAMTISTLALGRGVNSHGTLEIGGDGSGQLTANGGIRGGEFFTDGAGGTGLVLFTHSGTINFAPQIQGATIDIEQHGPGLTTLTASNAIRHLQILQGRLDLAASTTLTLQNGGEATVSNDATLGGNGAISGGTLIVEGRLLTTLTLNNGLTLETGAILDYADTALRITGGTLTIGGDILVDFNAIAMEEGHTYTILDWTGATGTASKTSFTATNLDPDTTGSFEVQGTQLLFTATAVPEPNTWFLLGTGLGILLLTARRRRNVQS